MKRELKCIAQSTTGGGTPRTENEEFWGGEIPWIQSSNLHFDNVNYVEFDKLVTTEGIKKSAAKLVPRESIAIVTRVGVGKLALIHQAFATSQDFLSLSNLTIDLQFGLYSIHLLLQAELNNLQGTSIKGITKDELLSKSLFVPKENSEQHQIGHLFSRIDKLITVNECDQKSPLTTVKEPKH